MLDKSKFSEAIKYLFLAKGREYTQDTVSVWYDALKNYPENEILTAIKRLALNPDDFINVGKVIQLMSKDDNSIIEKAWQECLLSAKCGGRAIISARAGKALNSFGGMQWLRDGNPDKIEWQKKQFIEAYKNTPEPDNIDFLCPGLVAKMYLNNGGENNVPLLQ